MIRRLLCCLALFALIACNEVYTAWPAITDSASVMDSSLLGEWLGEEKDSLRDTLVTALVISVDSGTRYRIIISGDSGKRDTITALLGRIGEHWVLDLDPPPFSEKGADLPLHFQVVIRVNDSMLWYSNLDPSTLRRPKTHLPFRQVVIFPNDDVLIGDTTESLVAGLSTYLSQPGALEDAESLFRKRPVPAVPTPRKRPR